MLNSSLCDYIDAYILVQENMPISNLLTTQAAANNTNKKVIFTDCITEINNSQVDNA